MPLYSDFHIHTVVSDGEPYPQEVVKYAKHIGLGAISITDHDSFLGSIIAVRERKEKIVVIPGAEVRTDWGDILTLCPSPIKISKNVYELVDIGRENGCLLIPAHPFDVLRLGIGSRSKCVKFWDGIEVFNGGSDPVSNILSILMLMNIPLPKISNSDAHVLSMVGSARTLILEECEDVECVLNALRKGLVRPVFNYGIRGLKNRVVWGIKRRMHYKKSEWIGVKIWEKIEK